jgi:two-component sensor histidine kinase
MREIFAGQGCKLGKACPPKIEMKVVKKVQMLMNILIGVLLLFGLYLTSLYSYLLFHSLAEIFSIIVACGIFMVAINSRKFIENNYFLFIGIAYLFIASLDLIHTLSYTDMGVFQEYDTNLPIQIWVAARYVESLTLFIAPLLIGRKLKINSMFLSYTIAISLLLSSIFYRNIFPDCFVEGVGLTQFKKISEYIISLILLASIFQLLQKRRKFDRGVLRLLVASVIVTIVSELAFTLYVEPYGLANLVGHFLKIVSFYLIYKATIETALMKPYNVLFRDLKQREQQLKSALTEKEVLLREVHHRVKNNLQELIYLIDMQAETLREPASIQTLKDFQGRISSVALIHNKLYQAEKLDKIDFGAYLEELTTHLFNAQAGGRVIRLNIDETAKVFIDLNTAIPCGMIVNELVTNAMKYAFPTDDVGSIGRDRVRPLRPSPEIRIFFKSWQGEYVLMVSDNGVGLPPEMDWRKTKSLGLKLVNIWATYQLRGSIELNSQNGTTFLIKFGCVPLIQPKFYR